MKALRTALEATKPIRHRTRLVIDRLVPYLVVISLAFSVMAFEMENRHLRDSFCGLVQVVGAPNAAPKVASSYGEVIYKQAQVTSRRLGC